MGARSLFAPHQQRLIEELTPDQQERRGDLDTDRDRYERDHSGRVQGPRLAEVEEVLEEDAGEDEAPEPKQGKASGAGRVSDLQHRVRRESLHRDRLAREEEQERSG